jgi:hypothetical protein
MSGGYSRGNEIPSVANTDNGSTFHALPDMPEAKYDHCMTVLGSGDIFVCGGFKGRTCFLYKNGGKRSTKSLKDFLRAKKIDQGAWTRCPGTEFTK